jgi:hypothetical protein
MERSLTSSYSLKRSLAAVAMTLMLPMGALAWVPHMNLMVTPSHVQVQVNNHTPQTIFCQGYVYGQLQTGVVVNSWFSNYIYPNGFQYAYVYSYGQVFINGWANINCQ